MQHRSESETLCEKKLRYFFKRSPHLLKLPLCSHLFQWFFFCFRLEGSQHSLPRRKQHVRNASAMQHTIVKRSRNSARQQCSLLPLRHFSYFLFVGKCSLEYILGRSLCNGHSKRNDEQGMRNDVLFVIPTY